MPREIVLLGGGHAHIEVIRRFGSNPIRDSRLTVFDPNPRPVYSGMVPGFVAGQYQRRELEIDLKALCDRSGATFIERAATEVRADSVELEGGERFAFDVASMDIGSTVAGVSSPGVREFALPSRPIATLISGLENLLKAASNQAPLHVIGAGAGGIELAFCLEAQLAASRPFARRVAIATSDPVVMESSPPHVRARIVKALESRGIRVLLNSRVSAIVEGAIELEGREPIPTSGAVWVTGPAAHPLAADSELPVDSRGFVRIAPTFLVDTLENLFAVGDCASLPGMRKAGVYAVRAGPILDENLRASLNGAPLRAYAPQDDFLSLLNLGDGTAIGSKWGLAFRGRWLMRLKDRIDRSFMEKYK